MRDNSPYWLYFANMLIKVFVCLIVFTLVPLIVLDFVAHTSAVFKYLPQVLIVFEVHQSVASLKKATEVVELMFL